MWGTADDRCRSGAPLARANALLAFLSAFCISGQSCQSIAADGVDALVPAPYTWASPAQGFDVTELAVIENGTEVERIHLTRIDPKKYKFEVHTAPDGARELADWMQHTSAAMIVNGSYFARDGKPATPVIARGQAQGPKAYGTKHGAFVVSSKGPVVQDLARTRWQTAFRGASEAMVSFPMLIGADGRSRAHNSDPQRTANRTFIGQDKAGRIIIGTTKSAYFSLDRFAVFLASSRLDLVRALNLDGGPPACQAVAVGNYRRSICSNSEISSDAGQLRVLGKLFGQRPWGLPIVLAVFPK